MTYKVLKSLVYGGIAYDEGQEVDIIEKSVAENCLERELIAEITDAEVDRTEVTDSTEITENNEDATEEVVSSETSEETTENEEEKKEDQTKANKRNRK